MGLKCHSSFVHYNTYHNNHCHGGGDIIGSVFNYTNNCGNNCGGGGFWGGFGTGLGLGIANLFGGFGMNMFGGFGMNMFSGFGNLFGGFGYGMPGMLGLGGGGGASDHDYSGYSSRSRRSTCDCKCDEKQEVDYTDADAQKRADFLEEINNLKAPIDQKTYQDLKTRIEAAREATKNDPKNLEADLKAYAELLENLDKIKALSAVKTEVPVVKPTVVAPITDPDLDFDINSDTYLAGYSDCTDEDLAKLSEVGVKRAHDVVGFAKTPQVRDVNANADNNPCIICENHTIKISDKALKDSNGVPKTIQYDYVGKTSAGQIVYRDKEKNQLYLLQKKSTGESLEYHLIQYAGMRGSGEAAHTSAI